MRIGITYLGMSQGIDEETTRQKYNEFFQQVEWANDKGFANIWITEHHFSTYSISASPLVLLAKAAAVAPDLRVGTGILVVPLWDPRRLAADVSTLDAITDGRVDLGIGRGYQPHEFAGFGQDLSESRARFEESVDLIIRLLTEIDTRHAGTYYDINAPVTVLPRPVQRPHPPIWAAAATPESIRFAVDRSFNFMGLAMAKPDELAAQWQQIVKLSQEAGHSVAGREFLANRFVYCTYDPDARRLAAREAARQILMSKTLGTGGFPVGGIVPDIGEIDPAIEALAYETVLAGTPDEIVEQVTAIAASGVTHISTAFQFGAMTTEAALKSMRLFAEGVLPAIADLGTRIPQTTLS
jgi:alkanesulfonate monooxygenase SsuD/methylene tetrahydromethanopterin reductase-like flavin-dependent oxidoreductase (luciferase family)